MHDSAVSSVTIVSEGTLDLDEVNSNSQESLFVFFWPNSFGLFRVI